LDFPETAGLVVCRFGVFASILKKNGLSRKKSSDKTGNILLTSLLQVETKITGALYRQRNG